MQRSVSSQPTTKGERTREHILATALSLFIEKGYAATTMRDIAAAAECSLGLTYRYFSQKEALVLALYQQIAHELASQVDALPPAPLADRFVQLMHLKFALLSPYRAAFGAWFGAALTPDSGIAVLGPETSEIRAVMLQSLRRIITGASDAPRQRHAEDLAVILYLAHLALILVWLHDRTSDRRVTAQLLNLSQDTLRRLRWFLRLPPVSQLLGRLAAALTPLVQGSD